MTTRVAILEFDVSRRTLRRRRRDGGLQGERPKSAPKNGEYHYRTADLAGLFRPRLRLR